MIKLEDGNYYLIVKEIQNDNDIYVYLTNAKDVNDFCIRKTNIEKEILSPLDNEEEYNKALKLFGNSQE